MESSFEETPAAAPSRRDAALAFLVELTGERVGTRHRLNELVLVGRAGTADVRLSGRDVSRHHARIRRDAEGRFTIEDIGSRHGVSVNGVPIQSATPLALGDRIKIGAEVLLLFTQQDRLEEQLLHSQRMESLGRLAGGIAHDFNNLIGAVLTNISYLEARPSADPLGAPEVEQTLRDCRVALNRAVDLTQQLLGFARRGRYAPVTIELQVMIREVLRLVDRSEQGSLIEMEVPKGLSVHGDAAQIHQVLMNVCLNAIDAVHDRGRVWIRARRATPEDRAAMGLAPCPEAQICLEVRDDGVGMDEETRRRAFEPFFTTKAIGHGTGLGLASVYGIVTHHGGSVHLDSVPGQGTTVRVLLPEARPGPPTWVDGAETTQTNPSAAPTVMVVDDDLLVRGSAARYLGHLGYRIVEAEDGMRAVEAARGARPDLVMLDMNMPGMDGVQTFDALRLMHPGLPVLLTTGESDEARARALLEQPNVRLHQKPYDVAALTRDIRELIGS